MYVSILLAMSVDADRREFQRAMSRAPRAPMDDVRDLTVPGGDGPIRARLLVPPRAGDTTLVYVHGGGWYLGDLDGWEPIARVIAQTTSCPVLEIDHRQAPEHPFPAALHDVRAALTWAVAELDAPRVGAVGDSSGGNLVAAAARHVEGLAIQVLVYPAVDLAESPPVDDTRQLSGTRQRYLGAADPTDPDASPLLAPDLAGLPPAVVCVAETDWLRAQGLAYAERLQDAGVPVRVVDGHGLGHAFLGSGSFSRRAAEAIAELGDAVRTTLAAH
jgi:acetyl esterase